MDTNTPSNTDTLHVILIHHATLTHFMQHRHTSCDTNTPCNTDTLHTILTHHATLTHLMQHRHTSCDTNTPCNTDTLHAILTHHATLTHLMQHNTFHVTVTPTNFMFTINIPWRLGLTTSTMQLVRDAKKQPCLPT